MKKNYIAFFLFFLFSLECSAQMTAEFSTTLNTNCLGQPCSYEGPTILINEMMITPLVGNGSISGGNVSQRGEWIELYNPNLCEPVDISCFYLGNSTNEGQGGVRLPDNLIVPPGGFVMVRGVNAPPVPVELLVANGGNVLEVVVPPIVTDEGVCCTGPRVWFPDSGGWFAFYDADGVPQDAVQWQNQNSQGVPPCSAVTTACSQTSPLLSYIDIPEDRKNYVSGTPPTNQSIRRIPDGGAWSSYGAPTYATCNTLPCATVGESTCTAQATITVSGGQAPYNYFWNDSQLQMTQTAEGLCAGVYQVTVIDNNGNTQVFEVTIEDFVPTVTLNVANEYCVYDDDVNLTNYTPVAQAGETGVMTGPGVTDFVFNPGGADVGTHTLTYTFTDAFGCTNFATDEIIVHPIPDVSINVAAEFCTYDPLATMNNVSPTPSAGGVGVLTGPGVNGFSFNPSVAGPGTHTITYTFTSVDGCVNSATDEVVVYQAPNVGFTATPTIGFESLEVEFTNTSAGATNYNWSFGDGNTTSGDFTNWTHIYEEYGNYTVTLIATENGCSDTASMLIQVLINPITYDIPNVFTPNGDNTNPFFTLINPIGFHRVEEFEVLILNRWGQLIRTFTEYNFAWDGKDENGNDVTEGVYFYKVYIRSVFGDIYENHGFVHLVRE